MKRKKTNTDSYWFNIFLVVLGIIGLWSWFVIYSDSFLTTNNAIVEGRLLTVNSRISGFVTHIYATNSLEVKKGDLLAEIDPTDISIKLRQTEDKLKTAKIKLAVCERNQAEENRLANRLSDFDNFAKTYGEGVAQHTQANKQVLTDPKPTVNGKALLNEEKPSEEEEEQLNPDELKAEIKQCESQIEQLKLDLSNTKIYATQDGVVSGINVREGEFVESSDSILSIIPKRVWISAYYTPLQAEKIVIGQPVIIKITKYPTRRFKGVVEDFRNDKENHTDRVQVRITFTEDYSDFDIKPASKVSASVKIK